MKFKEIYKIVNDEIYRLKSIQNIDDIESTRKISNLQYKFLSFYCSVYPFKDSLDSTSIDDFEVGEPEEFADIIKRHKLKKIMKII